MQLELCIYYYFATSASNSISLIFFTGVNILFSGIIDQFRVSNEAYHVLIPAMVKALTTLQTPYPYPPDPEVYEGVYSLGIPGQSNVNIVTFEDQLLMSGPRFNVFLAYRDPLHLQVTVTALNNKSRSRIKFTSKQIPITAQYMLFIPISAIILLILMHTDPLMLEKLVKSMSHKFVYIVSCTA